jgi:hypothetical protein
MRNRLVGLGKVSSGKLFDSLRFEVKETNNEITLSFKMAQHGQYVDKGVSGAGVPQGFGGKLKKVNKGQFDKEAGRVHAFTNKMPPEKSIKKWMQIQGIPKDKSFPIRRSIYIFGIAPTNFFTIPTTRRQKQYEAGIEKALGKDFEDLLGKDFK